MLLSRTLQTPVREDPSNTRCSKRLPQRLTASFVSSILGELSSLVSCVSLLLVQKRMRFEVLGFVPASAEDVVGVEASSVLASTNSLLPLVVSSFGVGQLCFPPVASVCACSAHYRRSPNCSMWLWVAIGLPLFTTPWGTSPQSTSEGNSRLLGFGATVEVYAGWRLRACRAMQWSVRSDGGRGFRASVPAPAHCRKG